MGPISEIAYQPRCFVRKVEASSKPTPQSQIFYPPYVCQPDFSFLFEPFANDISVAIAYCFYPETAHQLVAHLNLLANKEGGHKSFKRGNVN